MVDHVTAQRLGHHIVRPTVHRRLLQGCLLYSIVKSSSVQHRRCGRVDANQPDLVPSEPLNLCTAQHGERPQHDARQKLIGCSGEKLTHFGGGEDLDVNVVRFDSLRGFHWVVSGKPTGHRELKQGMQNRPIVGVATV